MSGDISIVLWYKYIPTLFVGYPLLVVRSDEHLWMSLFYGEQLVFADHFISSLHHRLPSDSRQIFPCAIFEDQPCKLTWDIFSNYLLIPINSTQIIPGAAPP